MGGSRGRLICSEKRLDTLAISMEAVESGARKQEVCEILGLSKRTLERWQKAGGEIDNRKGSNKVVANKLQEEEREMIIDTVNGLEYRDMPVSKIVPSLADKGIYLASESTIYRILRQEKLLTHRERSKPRTHYKPKECVAYSPNQVWSWDISYLPSNVTGFFCYLYIMMDIYSRKIVGWHIGPDRLNNRFLQKLLWSPLMSWVWQKHFFCFLPL